MKVPRMQVEAMLRVVAGPAKLPEMRAVLDVAHESGLDAGRIYEEIARERQATRGEMLPSYRAVMSSNKPPPNSEPAMP